MIKTMIAAVYAPADVGADVAEAEAATAKTAPKKQKVSERVVLDGEGKAQDSWLDAYGFSYKSLGEDFELRCMFDELPDPVARGLQAFGALTLAGNVTNTVRNGENKGGEETEKGALLAWIENLKAGNWTSPRGETEAGINLLAEAYSRAMTGLGKELTVEAALEKLKAAGKDKQKEIRGHSKVKVALTEILAERAKAKAATAPEEELIAL